MPRFPSLASALLLLLAADTTGAQDASASDALASSRLAWESYDVETYYFSYLNTTGLNLATETAAAFVNPGDYVTGVQVYKDSIIGVSNPRVAGGDADDVEATLLAEAFTVDAMFDQLEDLLEREEAGAINISTFDVEYDPAFGYVTSALVAAEDGNGTVAAIDLQLLGPLEPISLYLREWQVAVGQWNVEMPSAYSFSFRRRPLAEPPQLPDATLRIIVRDSQNIVSVKFADNNTDVPGWTRDTVRTITELLAEVGGFFLRDNSVIAHANVTFDEALGLPLSVFIDVDPLFDGEEVQFEVSDFVDIEGVPTIAPTESPTMAPTMSQMEMLEFNMGIFEASNITDYAYGYREIGDDQFDYSGAVILDVANGTITGVRPLGPDSITGDADEYPTVMDLFASLAVALEDETTNVEVRYDDKFGYPLFINVSAADVVVMNSTRMLQDMNDTMAPTAAPTMELSMNNTNSTNGTDVDTDMPTAAPSSMPSVSMLPTETISPFFVVSVESFAPYSVIQSGLDAALAQWGSLTETMANNYDAMTRVICFCPPDVTKPKIVQVRNGEIAAVLDLDTGTEVTNAATLSAFLTVATLHEMIQTSVSQRDPIIQAEFDTTAGYPSTIFIDEDVLRTDDEFNYIISELTFNTGPTGPESLIPPQDALDAALATWMAIDTTEYEFQYQRSCGCAESLQELVVVQVVNGTVTDIRKAEDTNSSVTDFVANLTPSIEALFTVIQQAIDQNASSVSVAYDETYGYPTLVSIDYNDATLNEELMVSLSNFKPKSQWGAELSAALALWEITSDEVGGNYSYRFQRICNCDEIETEPKIIGVVNDTVVSVDGDTNSSLLNQPTIMDLFNELQSALDKDPDEFDVDFDPEFGYPRSADVDFDVGIADEEIVFTAVYPFDLESTLAPTSTPTVMPTDPPTPMPVTSSPVSAPVVQPTSAGSQNDGSAASRQTYRGAITMLVAVAATMMWG